MKPVFFISDLHLCPTRPEIARLFLDFLHGHARRAGALYILGDLFEYWAGDDDNDTFNRSVVSAIRDCARKVEIRLMHGNRDFLIGASFVREFALELIADESVIDLFGKPTLLMHGDTLCTADTAYAAFRAEVRSPAWAQNFLAKPLAERRQQIEELRTQSELEKQGKLADLMDAQTVAVDGALRRHSCDRLIHGHTHRSARHLHVVDGRMCERWVLSDWYLKGSVLVCGPEAWGFEQVV